MSKYFRDETLVPILFLKGSYGTGKTTFTYRLVDELSRDEELEMLSFEVIDPEKLQVSDLAELSRLTDAKHIVLVFNHIEIDSSFKALIELRTRISVEQLQDISVIMLGSIRENILERYMQQHRYAYLFDVNIDSSMDEREAGDLLQKLSDVDLVRYRDAHAKNLLVKKIMQQYSGDTFTSLIGILTDSNHINYLLSAYNQLPDKAKEAFIYTSLLYRFGIKMPAYLLRRLISADWEAFLKDVIQVDCKGILIQENNYSSGTEPDLYFRTKHPIISELIVNYLYSDDDKRFGEYLKIVRQLTVNYNSAILIIDLLKYIRNTDDLSQDKIDKLFDACSQEFGDNPHFIIHYAINLQHRNDIELIRTAISKIIVVEGLQEKRNHRLIHRRAVLNYELAKRFYSIEKELYETIKYAREARELFDIKLRLDPFSSFSYIDFIRFEMWCLAKIILNEEEKLSQMIKIESLIGQAERSVYDDIESVVKTKNEYLRYHKKIIEEDKKAYVNYLENIYDNSKLRHLALVLLYYYYRNENNDLKCNSIINELESYAHYDSVAKILFSYYGRKLHLVENRKNLIKISRENTKLATLDPVNYHYYSYINAAYNRHFEESISHVNEIRNNCPTRNPVYHETWRDSETGEISIFTGVLERLRGGKFRVRIVDLQQVFGFTKNANLTDSIKEGMQVNVHLHFYLSGIRAEIINILNIKN